MESGIIQYYQLTPKLDTIYFVTVTKYSFHDSIVVFILTVLINPGKIT